MTAALRSLLFVPGNRPDMLEKALDLKPDAFIPDMEDSVPFAEKEGARKTVTEFLPRLAQAGPLVLPRVNSQETGLLRDDLAAVVGADIHGVTVGKVGSSAEVEVVSGILDDLEVAAGIERGRLTIIPWLETARGVVNAHDICSASPRVVAVAFGAEDFTADMAIQRTDDDSEVAYARSAVAVAARAAGVVALDTPYVQYKDADGLRADAAASRKVGFRGKFAIHPSQIDVINEAYAPTEVEIEEARRVIAASEEAERAGRGATSLDGKMIDAPVVARARKMLELAQAVEEEK